MVLFRVLAAGRPGVRQSEEGVRGHRAGDARARLRGLQRLYLRLRTGEQAVFLGRGHVRVVFVGDLCVEYQRKNHTGWHWARNANCVLCVKSSSLVAGGRADIISWWWWERGCLGRAEDEIPDAPKTTPPQTGKDRTRIF